MNHIKDRQISILQLLRGSIGMSATEVVRRVGSVSLATIKRDIGGLLKAGLVVSSGKGRTAGYTLTKQGELFTPIDAHVYCKDEPDKRNAFDRYDFALLPAIPSSVLNNNERVLLNDATRIFKERSSSLSDSLAQKELERFVIELSWKSSRIEGNTYTILDTERLVREGVEAEGHSHEEAVMILNHKKAFEFILVHRNEFAQTPSRAAIEEIHRILTDGLGIDRGLRRQVVGIVGTKYRPLDNEFQIQEAMNVLRESISRASDPYTAALIALLGISYIQPFGDGNKRTARLLGNAILLGHGLAPLSYRNVDEVAYREATLVFYETHSLVPFKEMFIAQYLFAADQYGIV
ncbi:MAG: Fic family protein [bacterium]|nr:Fic family protein [bacterium]